MRQGRQLWVDNLLLTREWLSRMHPLIGLMLLCVLLSMRVGCRDGSLLIPGSRPDLAEGLLRDHEAAEERKKEQEEARRQALKAERDRELLKVLKNFDPNVTRSDGNPEAVEE